MRSFAILLGAAICLTATCGPARADTATALDHLCHRPDLAPVIDTAAKRHHVSPMRLAVLMASESTCREDAVNPSTHALGLFQILTTGSANPGHLAPAQLLDPATNADLGAAHLARLLRLCGSFGAAVSIYHGHRRCGDWREDKHARKVAGVLVELRRWMARQAVKVS